MEGPMPVSGKSRTRFALDLQPQEIIRLTEAFMKEQRFK
jgi:hypothetical protein